MRWLRRPPGAALGAALVVATPIVLACVAGAFLGGAVAVLGIAPGVAGAVQAAVAAVGWPLRAAVVAVVPVVAAAGVESGPRSVTTGLLAALAASVGSPGAGGRSPAGSLSARPSALRRPWSCG